MRNRHLLVFGAIVAVAYALLVQHARVPFLITYGASTFENAYHLAIALLVCWTALECAAHLSRTRAVRCGHCDYSLKGMKCPECGGVVGESSER